eukprot:scaffold741_cov336-Pavlova_lutheri.AAC.73
MRKCWARKRKRVDAKVDAKVEQKRTGGGRERKTSRGVGGRMSDVDEGTKGTRTYFPKDPWNARVAHQLRERRASCGHSKRSIPCLSDAKRCILMRTTTIHVKL